MTIFHSLPSDCNRRTRKNENAGTFNFTSQIASSICTVAIMKPEKSDAIIFTSRCIRLSLVYNFMRGQALLLVKTRVLAPRNSRGIARQQPRRVQNGQPVPQTFHSHGISMFFPRPQFNHGHKLSVSTIVPRSCHFHGSSMPTNFPKSRSFHEQSTVMVFPRPWSGHKYGITTTAPLPTSRHAISKPASLRSPNFNLSFPANVHV